MLHRNAPHALLVVMQRNLLHQSARHAHLVIMQASMLRSAPCAALASFQLSLARPSALFALPVFMRKSVHLQNVQHASQVFLQPLVLPSVQHAAQADLPTPVALLSVPIVMPDLQLVIWVHQLVICAARAPIMLESVAPHALSAPQDTTQVMQGRHSAAHALFTRSPTRQRLCDALFVPLDRWPTQRAALSAHLFLQLP